MLLTFNLRVFLVSRRWILSAVTMGLLLLTACSNPPSEDMGEKFLAKKIADQSKGNIRLVSFTKVNGQLSGQVYGMEYEASIEFLHNGMWYAGGIAETSVKFEFGPASPIAFENTVMGGKTVQQGARTTVKGSLLFQKTERGWQGEDGEIY